MEGSLNRLGRETPNCARQDMCERVGRLETEQKATPRVTLQDWGGGRREAAVGRCAVCPASRKDKVRCGRGRWASCGASEGDKGSAARRKPFLLQKDLPRWALLPQVSHQLGGP